MSEVKLTERERAIIDAGLEEDGCYGFLPDHKILLTNIESIIKARMNQAWDEGYMASEKDARRVRSSSFHTSGCDCLVPTTNPYGDDDG